VILSHRFFSLVLGGSGRLPCQHSPGEYPGAPS
jgi:hypothetical protein